MSLLGVLPVRCLNPGCSDMGGGLSVPDGDIPVPKEGAGAVDVGWVGVVNSVIVVTDLLGKAVKIK